MIRIIRERDGSVSPAMIINMAEWSVSRCNVTGCAEHPNTIAVVPHGGGTVVIGLCEKHFQQGNVPGGAEFTLDLYGKVLADHLRGILEDEQAAS